MIEVYVYPNCCAGSRRACKLATFVPKAPSQPCHLRVDLIALIDAPAVLGWTRWREIGSRYGMGLTQRMLTHAMAAGRVPRQPVEPLAHVLLGALRESALFLADAQDHAQARREIGAVLDRLILSLGIPVGA